MCINLKLDHAYRDDSDTNWLGLNLQFDLNKLILR